MCVEATKVLYGEHKLQEIKVFHYSPVNELSLILIHGGAWRDPKNTYDDFLPLTRMLLSDKNNIKYNIFGVNYRLSPEVTHPYHLLDIVKALEMIHENYGVKQCLLLGHSVGATILMQLVNLSTILLLGGNTKTKLPPIEIKGFFFVDGIYDMSDLIDEYGSPYEEFVLGAYSTRESYTNASPLSWGRTEEFCTGDAELIVVHSLEDELLSLRQTRRFVDFLDKQKVAYKLETGNFGAHEEVYRRNELAEMISGCCKRLGQSHMKSAC